MIIDDEKRLQSKQAAAELKKVLDDRVEEHLKMKMHNPAIVHESKIKDKVDLQLRLGEKLLYYDRQEATYRLAIPTLILGLLFGAIGIAGAIEVGISDMEEGIIVLLTGIILLWTALHWLISYRVTYYFVTDKRLCIRTINFFNVPVNRDIAAGTILRIDLEEMSSPLKRHESTKHYLEVKVNNEKTAKIKSVSNNIILMKNSIEKLMIV